MARFCGWFAAVALMASTAASAYTPESGWWLNEFAGTGVNIEVQDNIVGLSYYDYTNSATRDSEWYTAAGALAQPPNPGVAGAVYTANMTLFESKGGKCFGCPYTLNTSAAVGTVTLTFQSAINATLVINRSDGRSESQTLRRFDFGYGSNKVDSLLGSWIATRNAQAAFDPVLNGFPTLPGGTVWSFEFLQHNPGSEQTASVVGCERGLFSTNGGGPRTDVTCNSQFPKGVRALYRERYGNSSNPADSTSRFFIRVEHYASLATPGSFGQIQRIFRLRPGLNRMEGYAFECAAGESVEQCDASLLSVLNVFNPARPVQSAVFFRYAGTRFAG